MYEKEGELGVETAHAGFAAFLDIKTVLDFSCISCRRKTLHRDKALLSISLELVGFCIDPSILLDSESRRRASPA